MKMTSCLFFLPFLSSLFALLICFSLPASLFSLISRGLAASFKSRRAQGCGVRALPPPPKKALWGPQGAGPSPGVPHAGAEEGSGDVEEGGGGLRIGAGVPLPCSRSPDTWVSPPPETRLSVRGEIWPGSCPFISPKSRSNLLSQPAQNLAGIARGAGRGEGPVCLKAFNAIKTSGLGAIGTARGRGSPAGWAGGPWGHPLRPHPRLWGRERGCRPSPFAE